MKEPGTYMEKMSLKSHPGSPVLIVQAGEKQLQHLGQ